VCCLLAVAIIGEIAGAIVLDRAAAAGAQVDAARDQLDTLVRLQLADEIGLRGYVATGDRSFEETATPVDAIDALAARLRGELAELKIADGDARIDAFLAARRRWKTEVARPLLADPSRADALTREKLGKSLLDDMRNAARPLHDELERTDADISHRLGFRVAADVGASIAVITLFAVAALGLGFARRDAVRALAREQSLVSALQQTLRVDGVALPRTATGFAYSSATREALVGGDLIDTWRADGTRGWFLIADVSGKGIQAARHSAFVQYAVRTLAAETSDPAAVLARFNRLFLDTFDEPSIFVVALLGTFDAAAGVLRYASAGHSTAFVVRGGAVEQLPPTGSIIGLDRDESYAVGTVPLQPGDTIVLATDGLTECRDRHGVMLGDDGVAALIASPSPGPQALCDRLLGEAQRRSGGEISDDLAILVLRILGTDVPAGGAPFSTLSAS
jgi:hypothetical protein